MGQDRGGVDKKDQSASVSVSEDGEGHCGGGGCGVEQKPYDDDGGKIAPHKHPKNPYDSNNPNNANNPRD